MAQIEEISLHINTIITKAFELVKQIYLYHNASNPTFLPLSLDTAHTRLVFPKNKDGKTRVSEQELRFAFVEIFNQYMESNGLNWYYSVEMPTRGNYCNSGVGERNALFDLAIMDSEFNRIALIEFKAKNPKEECYNKDLKKLANSEEEDTHTLKYFFQIVENHDNSTIESINRKTTLDNTMIVGNSRPISIRVYSISKEEEILNKTIV